MVLFEMDGQKNNECRDFLRGVCNRGSSCKFFHPPDANIIKKENKLPICKDFQNKGCERKMCKFLHISQQEEEEYNASGILPAHGGRPDKVRSLGMPGGRGGGPRPMHPPASDACKDFMNGVCNRGNRCKFSHINEESPNYGKRRRNDFGGPGEYMGGGQGQGHLAEDNEMLRRKISDLQRQVIDLRQMNDTLYEQNSKYRLQLRGGPGTAPPPATGQGANPAYGSGSFAGPAATGGGNQYSSFDGYSKF
ncbi:zinc finger CCCH domain-containing protein 10-like [Clytia hemisphaerica]|uniref:C3H1-type domain-containing protein n=1 Tax=Clytia hemisphaerica TaxID=252671 RepID=A0A7M5WU21_9CNID